MGYRIELWTEHEDNGAAINAFATRVGEDSLMLTAGEDVPEGEWVAFEVKLADGSVFLEGMGRCQGSTEKDPLWDVELGMLQLETRDQMLLERIQLAAEDLATGARPTGEVDISKLPADDSPPPPPPPLPKVAKKKKAGGDEKSPPKSDEAKKESGKKWPWQKTTEPGMPSPDPVEPPKAAPKVPSPPSPPVPSPPAPPARPVSKPPPAQPATPSVDLPISPLMRQRLMNLVPNLVAEGRVRDLAGAHELALQIGLQALETFLEDED